MSYDEEIKNKIRSKIVVDMRIVRRMINDAKMHLEKAQKNGEDDLRFFYSGYLFALRELLSYALDKDLTELIEEI